MEMSNRELIKTQSKRIFELENQLKDLKLRNKLLRDRPDLPPERLAINNELKEIRAFQDKFREAMRAFDATGFDEALWDLLTEINNNE